MIELRWPYKVVRRFVMGGLLMYTLALVVPLDGESRWFVLGFAILMAGCACLGIYLAGERFYANEQGVTRLVWGDPRADVDWDEVIAIKRVFPNNEFTQLSLYTRTARVDVLSTVENFAKLAPLVIAHVDPLVIDAGNGVRRLLDEVRAAAVVRG